MNGKFANEKQDAIPDSPFKRPGVAAERTVRPPVEMEPEIATVVNQLLKGSTPGMISVRLERDGMPPHLSKQIVQHARQRIKSRNRIRGGLLVLLGIGIGVAGAIGAVQQAGQRIVQKPLLTMMMVALMIIIYGLILASGRGRSY